MTLVETSAGVEFQRGTGSETGRAPGRCCTTSCDYVPVEGLADYETGARLYRECRQAGESVRALTDCLIAAVALRARLPVLHRDRDFDAIARHCGLQAERRES